MKKIVVNPDKCICCGACVSMCSNVFDFSDEGYATTKEEANVLDTMEDEVKEEALDALEGCPVGAIEEVESEEEAA
jgi:ferredoxin